MARFFSRVAFCALACLLLVATGAAAAPSFPALTGRVVDEAAILSPETQQHLSALLAQEEKQTGNQVVVATLKSTQGYAIETYGYQLGRAWGIGQKGKDNGALLIVVPSVHQVRIEVGYGLEGELTDAQSKIIIDEFMLPAFRRNDYDGGVVAGTQAILKVLGGVTLAPQEESAPDQDRNSGGAPWLLIIVFLIWVVFGRFLWPLFFLGSIFGSGGGRGGGFGGGFGGGGGFSGGGGSFGGGGASGSW
jgi:uncharacterized protein